MQRNIGMDSSFYTKRGFRVRRGISNPNRNNYSLNQEIGSYNSMLVNEEERKFAQKQYLKNMHKEILELHRNKALSSL